MRCTIRTIGLSFAILFCLTSLAIAVPTVTVGSYLAGPPGSPVTVTVTVSGGDAIAGLNFTFGTGPFSASPGNPNGTGPIVTAVDVLTGTIFASNNAGQGNPNPAGASARKIKATTTTTSGTVSANGLLATLTLNTTGLAPFSVYELRANLMSAAGGGAGTTFVDNSANVITPIVVNGELRFTPEPSTLVMAMLGAASLGAVAIRRHRARKAA